MKDIEELISNVIHNNELVKINDHLYLTREQMTILDANNINYKICNSISEVLFLVAECIENEEDSEELEEVAQSLQEFQYYHYTNK